MYKTLEEARDFFKEYGTSDLHDDYRIRFQSGDWENKFRDIPGTARYRLRFDAECPNDVDNHLDNIFEMFQFDLEDLAENGDVNNRDDALLHSADGAKKRGMSVKDVIVYEALLYKQEKEHSTEYAMFILGRALFE